MKLCANISMLFTEADMLSRFAFAKKAGFHAVEIQFPYVETLNDLVRVQQEGELVVPLINIPAGDLMSGGLGIACVPDKQDDIKRGVEQAIEYGLGLGVDSINLLSGKCPNEKDRNRYYDTFLHNLDYCADQLTSVGINTVFEAINTDDMPDFLIHSFSQQQQVIKDLNRQDVRAQYDLYHMNKMNEPIAEQLSNHLELIGHMQFADNPGRHEPGTGDLDLETLLQWICNSDYKAWMGAEYKPSRNTDATLDWMNWPMFQL